MHNIIEIEFKFNYFVPMPDAMLNKKADKPLSAKGEKARARLMQAALVVLERDGYHKMRIADVTREAGVAQGLFYHYFKDLKSLTVEVLTDFAQANQDPVETERGLVCADLCTQPGYRAQLRQAPGGNALSFAAGRRGPGVWRNAAH